MYFDESMTERIFETDKRFSDEPSAHTLGRLYWLTVVQRAEFLLCMENMELPSEKSAILLNYFSEFQRDYIDLITTGLDVRYDADRLEHPSEARLLELVRTKMGLIREEYGIAALVSDEYSKSFGAAYDYIADFLETQREVPDMFELVQQLDTEELIERIESLPTPTLE